MPMGREHCWVHGLKVILADTVENPEPPRGEERCMYSHLSHHPQAYQNTVLWLSLAVMSQAVNLLRL